MLPLFMLLRQIDLRRELNEARRSGNAAVDQMARALNGLEIRERMLFDRAMNEGGGNPIPTLLLTLNGSEDVIKSTAALLLGDVAPGVIDEEVRKEVVQSLINALALPTGDTPDPIALLRVQAAQALGKYHDSAAIPGLIEALQASFAPIRRSAGWALGEIGAPEAVTALAAAMSDRDGDARDAIHLALRRIGTAEAQMALEAWKNRPRG